MSFRRANSQIEAHTVISDLQHQASSLEVPGYRDGRGAGMAHSVRECLAQHLNDLDASLGWHGPGRFVVQSNHRDSQRIWSLLPRAVGVAGGSSGEGQSPGVPDIERRTCRNSAGQG